MLTPAKSYFHVLACFFFILLNVLNVLENSEILEIGFSFDYISLLL